MSDDDVTPLPVTEAHGSQPPDTGPPARHRLNRRRVLGLTGVGLAGVAGGVIGSDVAYGGPLSGRVSDGVETVRDHLAGPLEVISHDTALAAPGELFLTDMSEDNSQVLLLDSSGDVIWSRQGAGSYADFRLQQYQGRAVLTWWESDNVQGARPFAEGDLVVAELDGTEITRIQEQDGVGPDEHEFVITSDDTALTVYYVHHPMDLSRWGGAVDDVILSGAVREIDIATGEVLFAWDSIDHISPSESFAGIPTDPEEAWDYFHINSVNRTPDGDLVVSARHSWGVYGLSREDGEVRWRLGGKESDFAVPDDCAFAWQHDAIFEDEQTLRIFDNADDGTVQRNDESQVLVLDIDVEARTVSLQQTYRHPDRVVGWAMGNAQRLDNGNLLVGWGTAMRVTEFTAAGEVVYDASLPEYSYRAYKFQLPG